MPLLNEVLLATTTRLNQLTERSADLFSQTPVVVHVTWKTAEIWDPRIAYTGYLTIRTF